MGSRRRPAGTQKQPKKTTFKRQKTMAMTLATKPELKAYDISQGFSDFENTGHFEILNTPIKGDDRYERNGRAIRMKSIQIQARVGITLPTTTDITEDYLRYMIVYDKQSNGAPPSLGDLLRDSNAGNQTSAFSQINLDNRDRFEILKDVAFPTAYFSPATAASRTNQNILDKVRSTVNVDLFIPLKGREVVFNSNNAGSAADIQTGALYLMTTNQETANNNLYTMEYTTRLRYYDV